jgi:peroxiredoxin
MFRSPASVITRLGLLCLTATLGCEPEPTATNNPESGPESGPDSSTDPTPDPGGPTAVAEPADEPVDEPAPTDDTDEDEDGEDAPTTVAVADTSGGGDASAPAEEAKPKKKDKPEKKDKEPLPKPSHKLSGPKCQQSFNVGSNVKNFRLPSVKGDKTISPSGYRKRVMLLNFWGTWCKPCLKELPEFDRLYRKYRKHGLTLVAVATDEDPEPVQAFIDKHKLRAKVALEGEEAAGAYSRPNFPFTFVVSKGKIVAAYEYIDDACMGDLEQVIRDELEKLD